MLCGFAAISVDVGNMYRVRSQERAALDAAALAAAAALDGTTNGLGNARAAAIAQGRLHRVNRTNLELTAANITFGRWETGATDIDTSVTDEDRINAVRVIYTEPVNNPFGAVLGSRSSAIGARAIAIGGGPMNAPCAFPLVVPECAMDQATEGDSCGYLMQMQDNNSDTAGWTVFNNGPINGNTTADAVRAACATIDANGVCGPDCANRSSMDDPLSTNNGNFMNNSPNAVCNTISNILTRNGTPEAFTVTVPVMRTGPMQPCNPQFRARPDAQVAGFAQMTVFGIRCGNSTAPVIAPNNPNTPTTLPPSQSYILASLECRTRINAPAGGGSFWGLTGRPRLVQ